MARRPDALFATNIASLIFLPDLWFLAWTSFQSLNRPSLSLGSSSRISLLRQSFSVSRPRLRPPGNIHRWSHRLLTNNTRPRFVATSFDDFAITLRTASTPNRQCKFYSIPCTKKGTAFVQRTYRKSPGQYNRVSSTRHRTQRDVGQKTSRMGGITDSLAQIASNARQRRFLPDSFLAFRRGFFFAFSTSA